jgi:predicted transcriptional regulator
MGIKSFVSAKIGLKKTSSNPILIRDIMTRKLIVFSPEQTVVEVMEAIVKNKISGGPVTDNQGYVIGMISEGDCIREISQCRYYNIPMASHKIKEFMVTPVETVDAEMDVFDVCNRFTQKKRRRFPVIHEGKLVGQVSQIDVLKSILNAKHQEW